ncbi:Hsp20/alpha crystallin family protein [Peribacillus alkalitolerans]|uniref:Hsp20/alpha crystallin family protein n=1 Tax=Peribacillus alkalitolerans TaxID=1550385 RepID=UPI0013D79381|nr:Hsp20/alpha crystallin family protein [Peribacillus alkalitolerans]
MTQKNDEQKGIVKREKKDIFSEWMNTIDDLFGEKPINGILQSMDSFFTNASLSRGLAIKLEENQNDYVISVELPGVKKNQIEIECFNQSLSITVNQKELIQEKNVDKGTLFSKSSSQTLSRAISFPKPIVASKITANHEDGILKISIPKQRGTVIDL